MTTKTHKLKLEVIRQESDAGVISHYAFVTGDSIEGVEHRDLRRAIEMALSTPPPQRLTDEFKS